MNSTINICLKKNNELWCRACNVKLVHEKKSSGKQHLETITHLNLTNIINSNKKNQFKPSDRHDIEEFGKDWNLRIKF